MAEDNLAKVNGERTDAAEYNQIADIVTPILRSALRDKLRDLSNGNTPMEFPRTWIETINTSSGDDNSINTSATTADYKTDTNSTQEANVYTNPLNLLDDFNDGTVDTNLWEATVEEVGDDVPDLTVRTKRTEEANNELQMESEWSVGDNRYDPGGSSSKNWRIKHHFKRLNGTKALKHVKFDLYVDTYHVGTRSSHEALSSVRMLLGGSTIGLYQQIDSDTHSNNLAQGNNTYELIWTDSNTVELYRNGSLLNTYNISDTAQLDIYCYNGSCVDTETPPTDTDLNEDGNAMSYTDTARVQAYVDNYYENYGDAEVVTETIVTTSSELQMAYIDAMTYAESGAEVTIDVSVDGGANYDVTGLKPRQLADLADVVNSGTNLVLRFNLLTNSDGTNKAELQKFMAKGWV